MTERRISGAVLLLLTLAFLPARLLRAQTYTFQSYVEGLGNLNVTALLQDRAGYLWVGTQGGIYRYDGKSFQQFGREAGLQSIYVKSIVEDAKGNLWIAATDGLYVRNRRGKFTAVLYEGSRITAEKDATLLAIPDGRMCVFSPEGLLVVGVPDNSGGALAAHLLASSPDRKAPLQAGIVLEDGSWLTGSTRGVFHSANGEFKPVRPVPGLPAGDWGSFVRDGKRHIVWARSAFSVAAFDRNGRLLETVKLPYEASRQPSTALAVDTDGALLVTSGSTLFRRRETYWQAISAANGLDAEALGSILVDRAGLIWIGSLGLGLRKWLGYGEWEGFKVANGLRSNTVWAIIRDEKGRVWEGDQVGLSFQLPGESEFRPWRTGNIDTGVVFGIVQSRGALWIASAIGLTRIDERTLRATQWPIPNGGALRVFADSRGRVWAGAYHGLFVVQPGERRLREIEDPLVKGKKIRHITEAPDGEIWISTDAAPLSFDGVRWRHPSSDFRISGGPIYRFTFERPDQLWISGDFPGVYRCRWKAGSLSLENIVGMPELASDLTVAAVVDRSGSLWIGGDRGISVKQGSHWTRFVQGDGLIWDDISENAIYPDEDGSIWVGTSGGLSHFQPRSREFYRAVPPPVITSARIGAEDLLEGSRQLKASKNALEIGLTSLQFRNEKSIRFRYRLDGLDQDWVEASKWEIRYPRLLPRSYHFEAAAVDSSTGIESAPVRLDFEVFPPIWNRPAAKVLEILLGGLLAAGLWRWRTNAMRRRQSALERLVAERTEELDRRLAEQQALKAEADRANQAKSDFLAMMSHEIRTPLNGLIGMADLMMDTPLTEEQRDYAQTIQQSSDCLLAVINDILDFSKIEAGKLTLEQTEMNLAEVIADTVKLTRKVAAAKELYLKTEIPDEFAPSVIGDPVRLRQILLNLISNAVKFTATGGITVRLEPVAEMEGHVVSARISVTDTGIGLTQEAQARLFESFSQADTSVARKYGGTGLGLAISKRLTELMGGEIGVNSDGVSGSTFSFTLRLPRAVTAEFSGSSPATNESALALSRSLADFEESSSLADRGRLLLVDDNAVNQKVASKMLTRLGYHVELAGDGAAAIELWAKQRFDAILMDCQMPVTDGFAATAFIRQAEAGLARTPIIALTANAVTDERERCLGSGMDEFLTKPIQPQALEAVLRRWIPVRREDGETCRS